MSANLVTLSWDASIVAAFRHRVLLVEPITFFLGFQSRRCRVFSVPVRAVPRLTKQWSWNTDLRTVREGELEHFNKASATPVYHTITIADNRFYPM